MKYIVFLIPIILLGCSNETQTPTHYEAKCKEPIPVFTLGEYSNPTAEQEAALCACIWQNLKGWERETAEKLATGRKNEIPELYMRGFPPRFGEAIEKCGGMEL